MSGLDDALKALADVERLAADLCTALAAVRRAVQEEAHHQEAQRLTALHLAMSPVTPDLVGDYVPAEWSDKQKENTDDNDHH